MTVTKVGPALDRANQQFVGTPSPIAKTAGSVDGYYYPGLDAQPSHAIAASPSRSELIAHLNREEQSSVLLAKSGADHVALRTVNPLYANHELWAKPGITGAILEDQSLVNTSGTVEELAHNDRVMTRGMIGAGALLLGGVGAGLYFSEKE
jgi:hypothetical protein